MNPLEARLRDATEELIVACNSSVRPEKIVRAQQEWDEALKAILDQVDATQRVADGYASALADRGLL